MLLIGQSLELSHSSRIEAVRSEDRRAIREQVRAQLAAGAEAIDINGGPRADVADLAWCAEVLREAFPAVPLFIDTASALLLGEVLDACHRGALAPPFIANSIPVDAGGVPRQEGPLALRVAARTGAGVVISPRLVEPLDAPATAEVVADAGRHGASVARAAGVRDEVYVDALAFPPVSDALRCRRSLDTLRLLRALRESETAGSDGHLVPLTAAGNVGYGAPPPLAAALRAVYAAAAVGAGAGALILPVEETSTVRAVRLALGDCVPLDAADRWLAQVATAARAGARPEAAPAEYVEAARLIFG